MKNYIWNKIKKTYRYCANHNNSYQQHIIRVTVVYNIYYYSPTYISMDTPIRLSWKPFVIQSIYLRVHVLHACCVCTRSLYRIYVKYKIVVQLGRSSSNHARKTKYYAHFQWIGRVFIELGGASQSLLPALSLFSFILLLRQASDQICDTTIQRTFVSASPPPTDWASVWRCCCRLLPFVAVASCVYT